MDRGKLDKLGISRCIRRLVMALMVVGCSGKWSMLITREEKERKKQQQHIIVIITRGSYKKRRENINVDAGLSMMLGPPKTLLVRI